MKFSDYLPIVLGVIKDFRVIVTLVAMLLVLLFTKYVVNYGKKPKRPKVKKAPKPAPKPKAEGEGGENSGDGKAESGDDKAGDEKAAE